MGDEEFVASEAGKDAPPSGPAEIGSALETASRPPELKAMPPRQAGPDTRRNKRRRLGELPL